MYDSFLRVAAATPRIQTADCAFNAAQVAALAKEAAENGASLAVFPELCLTGYTCGDLFLQDSLLQGAEEALMWLCKETAGLDCLLVAGLPVRAGSTLYNAAAVIFHGKVLGLVPKTHLPNYSEFYELRHFAPAGEPVVVTVGGQHLLLSSDLLFCANQMPEFVLGVELCEDLWVPEPPSGRLARWGATVIANPSASDETIGKAGYRRLLVASQSARLMAAYVYADAGAGESVSDMVFAGHDLIGENGTLLAESQRFAEGLIYADLDLGRLQKDRLRSNTFGGASGGTRVWFDLPKKALALRRAVDPSPFVPKDPSALESRCAEVLAIQAAGLAGRLRHIGAKCVVVGLSGGLDSTLALLVCVQAFDSLGLPRAGIHAVTMPGFGTTGRTRSNAQLLAEAYGVSFAEIPIGEAVKVHFADIGQDPTNTDVTYENAQARERTQVLMDLANRLGGIVVGTGDLSELALGWATYNGDHMSMYGVNASVPKTLVRHLVRYVAGKSGPDLQAVLLDILATPVSPELLPPKDGEIAQRTEDLVGPYELHDFFLYYVLRFGFAPKKIFRLANTAFQGVYEPETIKHWLKTFYRRFFAQQFKRSCLPDGPKVGSAALSPRGDWRMPSDASARLWLEEVEAL